MELPYDVGAPYFASDRKQIIRGSQGDDEIGKNRIVSGVFFKKEGHLKARDTPYQASENPGWIPMENKKLKSFLLRPSHQISYN